MPTRWRAERNGSTQASDIDGDLGTKPKSMGNFFDFLKKINILTPFGSHFARFQSYLKELI